MNEDKKMVLTHLIKNQIGQVGSENQMRNIEHLGLTQVNNSWHGRIDSTWEITLKQENEARIWGEKHEPQV